MVIFETGRDETFGWQKGRGSYVKINYRGRIINGEIAFDPDRGENQLYIYQAPICIKAHYTAEDYAETKLRSEAPFINDGDIINVVIIKDNDGKFEKVSDKDYKVTVLGDYSDCALLKEVEE